MSSEAESINCDRHCAYCLKFLPSGSAKLCGKCYRRAYCSRECQVTDWKQEKGSQGHKIWCDLKCGEEDVDWEVRPVEGKGLGIFAKRPIPSKSRIIVDAIRPRDHPAIQDLMPIGGTLEEKIKFNEFADDKRLCLRLCRINHDCNENAALASYPELDVSALIAERDIQAGEEITRNYLMFGDFDFSAYASASAAKKFLLSKWGITCKPGCRCSDEKFWKLFKACADLHGDAQRFVFLGDIKRSMEAFRKLIGNFYSVRMPWSQRMGILYAAFGVGVTKKATLKEAIEYQRQGVEIGDAIWNPKSPEFQSQKSYYKAPSTYGSYLRLEKKN